VKLLRDALGDDPKAPRYVGGLRGRGYQLVAPVKVLGSEPSPPALVEVAASGEVPPGDAQSYDDPEPAAHETVARQPATRETVARELAAVPEEPRVAASSLATPPMPVPGPPAPAETVTRSAAVRTVRSRTLPIALLVLLAGVGLYVG